MPTELIPAPFANRLPYLPMPSMGMSRPMNVPGAILPNGVANPWALHNALETCQPAAYPTNNGSGSVNSYGGIERYDDGWEGSAGRSSVGWAPDAASAAGPRFGPLAYAPSSYGNHRAMSAAGSAMRSRSGSFSSVYSDAPRLVTPVYAPSPRPRRPSVSDCNGQCGHYKPAPKFTLEAPKRRNSVRRPTGVSPFSSSPLKNEAEYMPSPARRRSNDRRCSACERGCDC